MASFDETLQKAIEGDSAVSYGIVLRGVDKTGNVFYQKQAGHRTHDPASEPVSGSTFFKLASSSKLIASIALLQCVERGLIDLDEPVSRVVPEISELEVISFKSGDASSNEFEFRKPKTAMTLRHMLSHSAGNPPDILSEVLMAWRKSRGEETSIWGSDIQELYGIPLTYDPGEGWAYGGGLEWGAKIISRLNGGISCEQYLIENVFKPLGCQPPYATFDVAKRPDAKERLVETAQRTESGGLAPTSVTIGENATDEMGGSGLVCPPDHYVAILADIIANEPKLLKLETVTALFTPQFLPGSNALKGLHSPGGKMIYSIWSGVGDEDEVNHTLGGLFVGNEMKDLGQPSDIMMWDGAVNTAWFASRKHGVAGLIAAQLIPPSDSKFVEFFTAWKKDFWKQWRTAKQ